jgi:WD40 repeat protein
MNRRQFCQLTAALPFMFKGTAAHSAAPGWRSVSQLQHLNDIAVEQLDYHPGKRALASWGTDGSLLLQTLDRKTLLRLSEGTHLIGFMGQDFYYEQNGQVYQFSLDPKLNKSLTGARYESPLSPVIFSPNGQWIAGLRSGQLPAVRNLKTGQLTTLGAPPAIYAGERRLFSFSSDGKWLAVAQGVRAYLWNLAKPEDPITLPDLDSDVRQIQLSHDGRVTVMGSLGGQVVFYDRVRQKWLRELPLQSDLRCLSLDNSQLDSWLLMGSSIKEKALYSVPLPPVRDTHQLPPNPTKWPCQEETWSCWLRGKTAVTGHTSGHLQIWQRG